MEKDIDVFYVGDLIEKAIIYFTRDKEVPILSLQKAIFLFLYSYAVKNNHDYNEILKLAGFEPYKLGPFSEEVDGECDTLKGYDRLVIYKTGDNTVYKSKKNFTKDYTFDSIEKEVLNNVDMLLRKLSPMELTFYVYFHPVVDKNVRSYFTSSSILKDQLEKSQKHYLKSMERKGIIDEEAKDMIIYGNN